MIIISFMKEISTFFMNNLGLYIIHGLRLWYMQGLEGEAVVYHREIRYNAAPTQPTISWYDLPEGKRMSMIIISFMKEISTFFMNNLEPVVVEVPVDGLLQRLFQSKAWVEGQPLLSFSHVGHP